MLCGAESLQSRLTLCDAPDCSPPGSSVHGMLQARIWRGLPCLLLQGILLDPGMEPVSVSCIAGGFFTIRPTWEACIYIIFLRREKVKTWNTACILRVK